ncbi:MAG: hypothetical protein J5845_03440 [Lachnospiraceae bacterium]|nr:hypothetical protein [Lachnospiraceae bacterium]
MSQNNVSERKQKLRKQNKNRPNPNENVPKKVSKDQIKKERQRERNEAAAAAETPKKRKIAINLAMLKCLLLLVTAVGVAGIVYFDPTQKMRHVLRGIAIMGVPLAVFVTAEAYYRTSSKPKYLLRLVICAVLAQFPMNYLCTYDNARNAQMNIEYFDGLDEAGQVEYLLKWREFPVLNYVFTVMFALLFIWLLDLLYRKFVSPNTGIAWRGLLGACMVLLFTLGFLAAFVLQSLKIAESPILTLMLVFAVILLKSKPDLQALVCGIIGLTFGMLMGPDDGRIYYAVGACLPPFLFRYYHGRLGYDKENRPGIKISFYMYYLVILAVLCLLAIIRYGKLYGNG